VNEQRVGVVVAAGAGQRLDGVAPKALVQLRGEPLLVRSARTMGGVCGRLVVVVGEAWEEQARNLLAEAGINAGVCTGAKTRTGSVAAGLAACEPLRFTDLVGIHDAARPLVSDALIRRVFAAVCAGWDAAAPALPVVDTLKRVSESQAMVRTIDREGLWTVQTPQVFRWAVLRRAYQIPDRDATDDLALVERGGGRVRLVMGDPTNLKITYPRDLAMAEALLAGVGS
jgi:2-C-methyl-D-erythritol 4-phosphate cytidylyltransferase